MDLASLLPLYPSQNDINIQSLVYEYKEFRDLSLSLSEPIPKKGEYFTHQKLLPRLMRFCDNMLIMSAVGTGKTLTVVAVAEYMINHPEIGIDKCLILTHNVELSAHFKSEIVKMNYSLSQYRSEDILTSSIKSKITNALKSISVKSNGEPRSPPFEYDLQTHITFGNSLRNKSDGFLRRKYSGYLIAIDEVHRIAAKDLTLLKWNYFWDGKDTAGKVYEVKEITPEMEELEEMKELIPKAKPKRTFKYPTITELAYMRIHHLLHIAKVKTLLLSATPMENDPSDLAPVLNLILPMKEYPGQISSKKDWWSTATREILEPYFRGKISYVRAIDNRLDLITRGIRLKFIVKDVEIDRVLEVSEMSSLQVKEYVNTNLSLSENVEGLALPLRLISNLVFPDGSYKNPGKYILNRLAYEITDILPTMSDDLKDILRLSNLDMYSPKYKRIFDINNEHPRKACLIYTPFLTSGSYIITAIFNCNGYYPFLTMDGLNECDDYKRFATITVKLSDDRRQAIFKAFRLPENKSGKIIKVIIGSRLILYGLNISNVLLIQIAGPEWNEAKNYQAIGRAIRATSHIHILADLPMGERIKVLIYQHASVLPDEDYADSIDTRMYGIGQIKDKNISRVSRIAKELAVDCSFNIKRNVRSSDVSGSPECDYMPCSYSCAVTCKSFPLDYSNYNILYNDDLINELIRIIVSLFLTSSRFTFNTIVNRMMKSAISSPLLLSESAPADIAPPITTPALTSTSSSELPSERIDVKYIQRALYKLISEKIQVYDRFGMSCYVENHGDEVYLRRDYPIGSSNISDSYYMANLTAILHRGPSLVSPIDSSTVTNTLKAHGREVFFNLYYKLSTENRISVLERSIIDHVHPELIDRLKIFIVNNLVHVMKNQIRVVKADYGNPISYRRIFGYMRILDGKIWRDATKAEEISYESSIVSNQARIERSFDEKKLYGTIATIDGKFRIKNKIIKKTGKSIIKGSVCIEQKKEKVMGTVLHYMIRAPNPAIAISHNLMRQFLPGYFSHKTNPSEVKLLYEWYAMKTKNRKVFTVREACRVIKEYFIKHDLILWV